MNGKLLTFDAVIGGLGGIAAFLYGGWSGAMTCLIFCMAVDYLSGLVVAGFGRSLKSECGGLDSHIGWIGLAKKVITLILLAVVHVIGLTVPGAEALFEIAVIGYIANEAISICENARLMGISLGPINGLLDVLKPINEKNKEEKKDLDDAG